MALNAHLWLAGETQGDIQGSVTQAGREGSIMVIGFDHTVISPRDAATGLPTGHRQHQPVVITKEVDVASPRLWWAMANNENLRTFRLDFWQPSTAGPEVQFYTIELVNAKISTMKTEMLNNKYPENMQHKEREKIAFVYERIIWLFQGDGFNAEDTWEPQIV